MKVVDVGDGISCTVVVGIVLAAVLAAPPVPIEAVSSNRYCESLCTGCRPSSVSASTAGVVVGRPLPTD